MCVKLVNDSIIPDQSINDSMIPEQSITKEKSTYNFTNCNKELIFTDSLRQHYGKMSINELTGCFQINEIMFVCKGEIPIYTYTPGLDCEATLLHPSTVKTPDTCEYNFFKLKKTFWIPLYKSNQWLFVAPEMETFTVLCPQGTSTLKLKGEGKLTLKPECKEYSSYVTLYAISTFYVNLTNDYVPSAPIDFDCCFEGVKDVNFEELPLHIPLVNIMSSVDDLRIISKKTEEVQQLIKEQEIKQNEKFYMITTSWGTAVAIICIIILCVCCSCCCCKCCRKCFFWFWDKWSPKDCWQQTKERCCINIHNYNGSRVEYRKTNTSPVGSVKSLPEGDNVVVELKDLKGRTGEISKSETDIDKVLRRTKNRRMFR